MYRFTELVLDYTKEELDAWKQGDKSIIPIWSSIPNEVFNQPNYHFGEYFVLKYFSDRGWFGFVNYAIGEWEPDNKKYYEGRKAIEEKVDPQRLAHFREIRRGFTGGEPDVFIFKVTGEMRFIEVKKGTDRVSEKQLQCLAQIKGILKADIDIVYLKEKTKSYSPRTYELDTENFSGKLIATPGKTA